jgi:uncharacterized protein
MRIRAGLEIDDAALASFCRRHGLRSLALYGSATRDDFTDASDIDILVEFEPGHLPGLIRLAGMELELSALFDGREVELRTYDDLSRYFRDQVRDSAVELYAA